jgi:hypothetical protein
LEEKAARLMKCKEHRSHRCSFSLMCWRAEEVSARPRLAEMRAVGLAHHLDTTEDALGLQLGSRAVLAALEAGTGMART